jgi:hypothetical protein
VLAQGNGTVCGEVAAVRGEAAWCVPVPVPVLDVVLDVGVDSELPQAPITSAPSSAESV